MIQTTTSVVFFGTPEYAVPTLRALHADATFEILAVVTQPDRPAGRGHRLVSPPVKDVAVELGLPILQPITLRDAGARDHLRALHADLFVVAAYGLIFSEAILTMPRFGCVNLHASILPAYRGAAPVTAAILSGDETTGVALMEMERGLDTGAVIALSETTILPTDTTDVLTMRLGILGADLAIQELPGYVAGERSAVPQGDGATKVRQLVKADGEIDWTQPAEQIERHVRAMWPWPRAWTRSDDLVLQIHQARIGQGAQIDPGSTATIDRSFAIGTGTAPLIIEVGQLPGGRPISGVDLAEKIQIKAGERFDLRLPPDVPLISSV